MKKLAELKLGAHFMYGGVEWVKFEDIGAGTFCLAAEPVFHRVFDEENCNDWRKSSLRRELNGVFLDALVAEGANRAAFLDWESDLTADDGMTDYGTAVDKIALRSDAIMSALNDYTTYLWGDALGTAVAALFQPKQDAEEMERDGNG